MDGLEAIGQALAARMKAAAVGMTLAEEGAAGVSFNASWPTPTNPRTPMWFGGVRVGKAYVSYHLMPVYTHPELAARISPALRKRMQGKSCFNFKAADAALFDELEALTREGAALYATPMAPVRKGRP